MKSHSIDSTADAIILFDRAEVEVDPKYLSAGVVRRRHIRIKIFKKSAFSEWGDLKLQIEKGGLSKVRAATFNLENDIIVKSELSKNSIYKTNLTKNVQQVGFAFPNVKEGSIIDLMYTETILYIYFPTWQFQYSIPNLSSEYMLITDRTNYQHYLRGTLKLQKHEILYEGKRQRWSMENIPAFKPEPLMPNKNVYQASLLFSSKGWLNIHLDLINNYSFYGLVVGNDFLKPIVEDMIDSVQSEKQKLKMISNFIKRNVDWNGINDFLGDPPKKILELKTGTSGDINLLFASMLAKAGFDVTLVLLSTRDNGFVIDNFPSANQFNYVICLVNVDGQEILLDATDGMLPYDLLPEKCFNHKGLYVSPSGYGWIGIEPIAKDRTAITANLVLDESGNLTGHVKLTLGGYRAHSIRKERISENPLEYFEKQELSISNIKLESLLDIEKPVIAEGELTVNNSATIVSNSIFINPNIFISEKFNPFVAETRVFPVDFGNLTERIIILSIEYPENYIIDELPQNKIISLPLNSAKAVFNYSQNSNRITITTHFQINKTLFMQEEYPALREFYSRLIAKESESIVLKKRL